MDELVKAGILRETTGRQRGRLFGYGRYIDILSRGTEPLPRGQSSPITPPAPATGLTD